MAGKNALRRFRIIDRCLRNRLRPYPTKEYLLEKLLEEGIKISPSLLDKDINFLRNEEDAPIQYDRANNGYCYSDPEYAYAKNLLSEYDQWIMDFANASMSIYGYAMEEKFQKISAKLIKGSASDKMYPDGLGKYLIPEAAEVNRGYRFLYDLYRAIIEQRVYTISYHPFSRNPTKHNISPYLLKQYNNRWYVIAFSHGKTKTLVFALDRIHDIKKSHLAYKVDPDFDQVSYFKYSFGITHKYAESPQKIKLAFDKEQKDYVLSMPLHFSQKNQVKGDKLIVEIEVIISQELIMKILSYGQGVKVLAPANLVTIIRDSLAEAVKLYG
ncbi:MAG: helix-turn-helix transcriptional regulator [Chitinophagaceae bacterium]